MKGEAKVIENDMWDWRKYHNCNAGYPEVSDDDEILHEMRLKNDHDSDDSYKGKAILKNGHIKHAVYAATDR